MPLYIKNGTSSILQSGGSVAAGADCCCPSTCTGTNCDDDNGPDYMEVVVAGITNQSGSCTCNDYNGTYILPRSSSVNGVSCGWKKTITNSCDGVDTIDCGVGVSVGGSPNPCYWVFVRFWAGESGGTLKFQWNEATGSGGFGGRSVMPTCGAFSALALPVNYTSTYYFDNTANCQGPASTISITAIP